MTYKDKWCPNLDLNQGHTDFQSVALPTELFGRSDASRTRK